MSYSVLGAAYLLIILRNAPSDELVTSSSCSLFDSWLTSNNSLWSRWVHIFHQSQKNVLSYSAAPPSLVLFLLNLCPCCHFYFWSDLHWWRLPRLEQAGSHLLHQSLKYVLSYGQLFQVFFWQTVLLNNWFCASTAYYFLIALNKSVCCLAKLQLGEKSLVVKSNKDTFNQIPWFLLSHNQNIETERRIFYCTIIS